MDAGNPTRWLAVPSVNDPFAKRQNLTFESRPEALSAQNDAPNPDRDREEAALVLPGVSRGSTENYPRVS